MEARVHAKKEKRQMQPGPVHACVRVTLNPVQMAHHHRLPPPPSPQAGTPERWRAADSPWQRSCRVRLACPACTAPAPAGPSGRGGERPTSSASSSREEEAIRRARAGPRSSRCSRRRRSCTGARRSWTRRLGEGAACRAGKPVRELWWPLPFASFFFFLRTHFLSRIHVQHTRRGHARPNFHDEPNCWIVSLLRERCKVQRSARFSLETSPNNRNRALADILDAFPFTKAAVRVPPLHMQHLQDLLAELHFDICQIFRSTPTRFTRRWT